MIIDDLIPLATKIDELKPWGKNPRKGSVDTVMKSLAKFGQRKPIVVNRSTREVIAGNHTFEAAKQLGWKQIAVVWVDDDEKTATAFALADNRASDLGYYDEEALEELIQSLNEQDLLIASGYADDLDMPSDEMLRPSTTVIPQDPNAITTQYTDSVDGTIAQRVAPQLDPNMAMIVKIGGIELRLERQEAEPLVNAYRRYVEKKGTATGFFLWLIEGKDVPE
jgi:hypothetical protein